MTSDDNALPEDEFDSVDGHEGEEGLDGFGQPQLEEIIAQLEAENGELRDKVLRGAAEMENLRKRTERELNDTRSYAIAGFARDMLVATDNLSRALMVMPDEVRESADGSLKSLIEGIEMTEREMQRLLQKNGVKPIEAMGDKFDPHRHQAMFEVPDPSSPEGTVVQVVQTGYAIGERILRPAMVGVAKGGPKPARPNSDTTAKPDAAPEEPTGTDNGSDGEGIDKSV